MLNSHLIAKTAPIAQAEQTFLFAEHNVRLTVLTPSLLRFEKGVFTDEATQIVWFRDLGKVECSAEDTATEFIITTNATKFIYNKTKRAVTEVVLNGSRVGVSNKGNLLGTRRTLDGTMGKCKLEKGLMSTTGVAVIEDNSLILNKEGMVQSRNKSDDNYIFVGLDYREVLKDFYGITGKPPMVARAVLGNWWSRYYAYTQEEYLELMQKFENKEIPFSIATIDMDWHYVNLKKHFGNKYMFTSGWTGYSVDKSLIPDHKAMFKSLHEKGMQTTLNLHPATGVRSFEDQYQTMCAEMGIDPKSGKKVEFDFTDAKFINAYFDKLHRPLEEDGVDFWWIDWQQGRKSKLKGYDPLWGLNHYHTLDNAIGNRRPLVLSRYAKLGSHRYPLGFSGDTIVSWRTLQFQPYFTATAANCGYATWSHDIGGHLSGRQKSDELYLRWIQFGIFSPILRLHSTKSALSKEPWNHAEVAETAIKFLRFRHRLIPYIYTAYYRSHKEGRAICEPMYYNHQGDDRAYKFPNEYYFGSELLVLPITAPKGQDSDMSKVNMWLPEQKRYVDIFTKEVYSGGGVHTMNRSLDSIPVLAKEGAIIPLSNNKGNDVTNPTSLELMACSGNGMFEMYEDDSVSENYKQGQCAITTFEIKRQDDSLEFTINPTKGDISLVPNEREYSLNVLDIAATGSILVTQNGNTMQHLQDNNVVKIKGVKPTDKIIFTFKGVKTI